MSPILPLPPGVAVGFDEPVTRRFLPPSPANLFAVGLFDRGDRGQGAGIADLRRTFGLSTPYSITNDALTAAIVEAGGATWSAARVVGAGATHAAVTLKDATNADSITVTAKSAGPWANGTTGGLKVAVTAVETTQRRLTVTLDDDTVATSPTCATVAELAAWTADQDYVTVTAVGTELPAAVAATDLAGGDDDRANVDVTAYTVALAKLDRRYGPGLLICDSTDPAVQVAVLEHCASHNRVARFPLPADIDVQDAVEHKQAVEADAVVPSRGKVFDGWAYITPIAGEAERLVPWAAIQAGIDSRIIRDRGVDAPTFGPANAASRYASRLYRERTEAELGDLYAAGVNVPQDDGGAIAIWGSKTLDSTPLHSDGTHIVVRMGLQFDFEGVLREFIGSPLDSATLASLHGRLDAICIAYQRDRALFGTAEDPGYRIDVESVNNTTTMGNRELHAAVAIRQTPTADWVDLLITVRAITQAL